MIQRKKILPVRYLNPAEIYITDKPFMVKTVLGSCVSLTMFSERLRIGAICHGLLPRCPERKSCSGDCDNCAKYVECSIKHMLSKFTSRGIRRNEIEIKLFGGANMFKIGAGVRASVGDQNVKTALKTMEKERLKLHKSDVGGLRGRKIFFNTETGEVLLKRLGEKSSALRLQNSLLKNERDKTHKERPYK